MITLSRRKLIGGLGLFLAAPAIIRVADLMPIKAVKAAVVDDGFWFNTAEYEALNEQAVITMLKHVIEMRRLHKEAIKGFLALERIYAGDPVQFVNFLLPAPNRPMTLPVG